MFALACLCPLMDIVMGYVRPYIKIDIAVSGRFFELHLIAPFIAIQQCLVYDLSHFTCLLPLSLFPSNTI